MAQLDTKQSGASLDQQEKDKALKIQNELLTKLKDEVKSNSDIKQLKKDVFKRWEKLKSTFRSDTSMFYNAGIGILGDMEKKYQSILSSFGLNSIEKNLGIDWKVNVQNIRNKFENQAKLFKGVLDKSWWFGVFSNNEKMIATVAQEISNIQQPFINQIIKEYRKEVINKSAKDNEKINKNISVQWAIVNNTFTRSANPLTIHALLKSSSFSANEKLVLDYSTCKSPSIKNQILSYSPTKSPRLVIEKKRINGVDTFVYEWTDKRAIVWEWVKMLPAIVDLAQKTGLDYQQKTKQETEKIQQEQLWILKNYKSLGISFKNGMKITEKEDLNVSTKLYTFVESELNRLVQEALNGVSTPKTPDAPFAGAFTAGKLLVFKTVSSKADQYILRESELQNLLWNDMWSKVYDFLDKSENEAILKSFLNGRWKTLYQEKVTKNKNFALDAKKAWLQYKNGKVVDATSKEVVLDENQVFVEGLDIDWGKPENAVWIQNIIEQQMDNLIGEIKGGKITMPENANPFNTNKALTDHLIEFDQENGVMDYRLFFPQDFTGKWDIRKIFTQNNNTYKIVQYMNKQWKDKYTQYVKSSSKIESISNEKNPVNLNNKIKSSLADIISTYKNNDGELNEKQKAELRVKIQEVSKGLANLNTYVFTMPDNKYKTTIMNNIPVFAAKLAEITSGTWGRFTWIFDADILENALLKSDAEDNIQIAIQNIDSEIMGKNIDQLFDLYISKHKSIDKNFSKIDGFKEQAPIYMHEIGEKIFKHIKETKVDNKFTIENKREKLFDLAQIARDQSAKINIDNKFIDYDLSEEIFGELFNGQGGIIDKLDADKAIKPEHKESAKLTSIQRKTLFKNFPWWDQIAKQKWVDLPYKNLSIEQRVLLATYQNYQNRFGQIESQNLQDPIYLNLVAKQLVEMTQLTCKFMMDDYSDRLDNLAKVGGAVSIDAMFMKLSQFDQKITRAYVDMKGIGFANLTDRNTQKMKEYSAMAATLIVAVAATVATAGAAGPALAAAISWAATAVWLSLSATAAAMASSAIIGGLVWSAVMIGSEFLQGKAYETANDWWIDTSTMTAVFVGTSLLTMGVGNFLNKCPWLKSFFSSSKGWINKTATLVQSSWDGALMWAVENQRQLWLTGESHPEMIFQMMGLAMGMRIIFSGFMPKNSSKVDNSLARKYLNEWKWDKLMENHDVLIRWMKKELAKTKDAKAKEQLKNLISSYEEYGRQYRGEQAKQQNAKETNSENKKSSNKGSQKSTPNNSVESMTPEQMKTRLSEIDIEITNIKNWKTADTFAQESNTALENRIANLKKNLYRWPKYQEQSDLAEKILKERLDAIKNLETEKTVLESKLNRTTSSKSSTVENASTSSGKINAKWWTLDPANAPSNRVKEINTELKNVSNRLKQLNKNGDYNMPEAQKLRIERDRLTIERDNLIWWKLNNANILNKNPRIYEFTEIPKKSFEVDAKSYDISINRSSYYDNFATKTKKYANIQKQYKDYYGNNKELKRIDTEFGEQLLLDEGLVIEYSKKVYEWNISAKERCLLSYEHLNTIPRYKWRLKVSSYWDDKFYIEITPKKNIKTKQKAIEAKQEQKAIGPAPEQKAIGPAPEQKAIGPAPEQKQIGYKEILALPPHEIPKAFPNAKFPYRLLPIFLLPLEDDRRHIIYDIGKDIQDMINDPAKNGIELDPDITWPYDMNKLNSIDRESLKKEIVVVFEKLLNDNNIDFPLAQNALISLRWVASWTYIGSGSANVYNEALAEKRAEEFKKYLIERYPWLTDANFITGSFHKADEVKDDAKRFQWVSMSVINLKNYPAGLNLPTWQDGRVK